MQLDQHFPKNKDSQRDQLQAPWPDSSCRRSQQVPGSDADQQPFLEQSCENVAAKGNRTLGFIKRNLRECTKQVKAASYTTLVRPVLEYSSTVRDPPTQSNIQTLEQIQKRAARFVKNIETTRTSCCVTRMQKDLGWDTLHKRRLDNRLSMLYKIDHQLVDVKTKWRQ